MAVKHAANAKSYTKSRLYSQLRGVVRDRQGQEGAVADHTAGDLQIDGPVWMRLRRAGGAQAVMDGRVVGGHAPLAPGVRGGRRARRDTFNHIHHRRFFTAETDVRQ